MSDLLANLLTNCLLALILIGLVWVVTLRWRSPFLAYSLWLVIMLKLVVAPFSIIDIPMIPWVENAAAGTVSTLALSDGALIDSSPLGRESFGVEPIHSDRWIAKDINWIFLIWAAGSIFWFQLVAIRSIRFHRAVQRLSNAPCELQERVQALAAQFSVKTPLLVKFTYRVMPPVLWCFTRRPCLVLPQPLVAQLTSLELDTLLTHELMHLKRRDHWARCFEALAVGIYWWNPMVWFVKKQLHQACELCCDSTVVGHFPEQAREYGETLLKTVNFISDARSNRLPVGANAIGRTPHLVRRVEMILTYSGSLEFKPRLWALVLVAVLLAIPVSAQTFPVEATDGNVSDPLALLNNETPAGAQELEVSQEWKRWRFEYSVDDRDEYESILQSFGIYLGVVNRSTDRVDFLTDLTAETATVETGNRRSEKAQSLYFQSTESRIQEWDLAIAQDAGLEAEGDLIVPFYPKEVQKHLLKLELEVCNLDDRELNEVQKVLFGCRAKESGEGFEYFVKEIWYRTKEG